MLELQDAGVLRSVLEGLPAAVYVVDRERKIVLWNDGAERITGYLREEVIGRLCREDVLVHRDENMQLLCGLNCPLAETIRDGKPRDSQVYLLHRAGHRVPVHVWAAPLRDHHGTIIGAVESFEETPAARAHEEIRNSALLQGWLDELTGLPARGFTEWHLRQCLAAKQSVSFGILCVEIENLDALRALDGSEAESTILRVVSRTLRNILGRNDYVGGWSNNRFLALLANRAGSDVVEIGERIRKLIDCCHIQWWGDRLLVHASVGTASVQSGDSFDSLVARAEAGLGKPGATKSRAAGSGSSE